MTFDVAIDIFWAIYAVTAGPFILWVLVKELWWDGRKFKRHLADMHQQHEQRMAEIRSRHYVIAGGPVKSGRSAPNDPMIPDRRR
jgi:hypothetical protein